MKYLFNWFFTLFSVKDIKNKTKCFKIKGFCNRWNIIQIMKMSVSFLLTIKSVLLKCFAPWAGENGGYGPNFTTSNGISFVEGYFLHPNQYLHSKREKEYIYIYILVVLGKKRRRLGIMARWFLPNQKQKLWSIFDAV